MTNQPKFQSAFIPVTVAQGIETKIDPNLVQPPKGLQADNVRLTTLGATRKRYGMQLMPSAGAGTVNVASTNNQLIALNSNTLSAYDFDDSAWISNSYGATVEANSISSIALGTQSTVPYGGAYNPCVAYIGTIGIYCYEFISVPSGTTNFDQSYWINITCFDVNSGQVFWSQQQNVAQRTTGSAGYALFNHGNAAPGTTIAPKYGLMNVQVIEWGNQFLLSFVQCETLSSSSYGPIAQFLRVFAFAPSRSAKINLYTGANCTQLDNYAFPTYWGTTTTSFNVTPGLHYCAARNATDLLIGVCGSNPSDSTSQLVAIRSNVMPATQSSAFSSVTATGPSSVVPVMTSMSDTLTVALLSLQSMTYAVATATGSLSGFVSSTSSANGLNVPFDVRVKATSATTATYTISDGFSVYTGSYSATTGFAPGTPRATSIIMASSATSCSLASRIVTYNSAPCAWVIVGRKGAAYSSLMFLNLLTSEVIARVFYLQLSYTGGARPPSAFLLNGQPTALLLQASEDAADNLQYAKLVSVIPGQNQVVRTPDGAIITGADTKYYDNSLVRSAGWLKIPEIDTVGITQSAIAGGLVSGFQYSYILVLADFDLAGNAIYSSPSTPYAFTPTANNVSASIPVSNVWPQYLVSTTGPILFIYRNSYFDPLSYNLVITQYMSSGAPSSLLDSTPDNNTSNAELYSQPAGGEQPNDPAPPSTCAVATKTRVFLAGAERGSALYFSKPFFAGRAPEFNYGNVLDIEPATGPIIGLSAIDDVVVIFKSNYIYLLSGQGPDATGQGVFSAITNISTDRGLVDKNSLVLSNDGVYFRSQRGIELLDRSFTLNYIGQPIETLLGSSSIVSAISVPQESQVRFAASDGRTYVYDYTAQGWTTYSYALTSVTGTPLTSSQTVFKGTAYSAVNGTSGGQVYQESQGAFLDETNLYSYTIQTAHMPLSGPQGWGRIRRANILGVTATIPSRISVQFVYDYGQVTSPAITYDITQLGAFNVRIRAPRQVAQAVSVIVQNLTSSGTGEGSYITGIVFETLQKSGALRLPDTQSV